MEQILAEMPDTKPARKRLLQESDYVQFSEGENELHEPILTVKIDVDEEKIEHKDDNYLSILAFILSTGKFLIDRIGESPENKPMEKKEYSKKDMQKKIIRAKTEVFEEMRDRGFAHALGLTLEEYRFQQDDPDLNKKRKKAMDQSRAEDKKFGKRKLTEKLGRKIEQDFIKKYAPR